MFVHIFANSAPAAGVAMGLVTKYNKENTAELLDYRILTDILVNNRNYSKKFGFFFEEYKWIYFYLV